MKALLSILGRAIVKGWRDDGGGMSLVSQHRVKIEEEKFVRNVEESIPVHQLGMVVDGGEDQLPLPFPASKDSQKSVEHGSISLTCK
jgi:hypothetical protein